MTTYTKPQRAILYAYHYKTDWFSVLNFYFRVSSGSFPAWGRLSWERISLEAPFSALFIEDKLDHDGQEDDEWFCFDVTKLPQLL